MSDILWFVFEQALSIFQSAVFVYFAISILGFNNKTNKYFAFAVGILAEYTMVLLLNEFNFFEHSQAFIYSITLFIFTLIFANETIPKKLLISLIPTNCAIGSSMLASNLTSFIFQNSVESLMTESTVYRIFFVVLGNFLFFLLTWIIKVFLKKNMKSLSKYEWMIMILLLTISIITIVLVYSSIIYGVSNKVLFLLYLVIGCIVVINVSTYFLLIQLSKKHNLTLEHTLLKQHYKHQAESITEIKNQYEELQKVRHDFNNTLSIVQTLCENNDPENAKKYISQYFNSQKQAVHFTSTNNEYVNAIINSMLSKAYKENIIVKSNIASKIEWTNNIDLCNLIGNLFENAITASKECTDRKEIFFEISKTPNGLEIFIKNTIPKSVLENNAELKTSKKNKKQHGYGTKIIKEIADKYSGLCDFYEDDNNMFCCNIMLYNK